MQYRRTVDGVPLAVKFPKPIPDHCLGSCRLLVDTRNRRMMEEIAMNGRVGVSDHLVRMVGWGLCVESSRICMAMEHCSMGDLGTFRLEHSKRAKDRGGVDTFPYRGRVKHSSMYYISCPVCVIDLVISRLPH